MAAKPATGPALPSGIDELLIPGVPANVRPGGRFKVTEVTNDLYNIAERIKEISPRLFINITEDQGTGSKAYTIVEETPTGSQVVFRCNVLDARVLEHVQYLIKVPFAQRFAEAERRAEKYEAEAQEDEMSDLVERIGLPMLRDLKQCGFLGAYEAGSTSRRRFGAGG